MRCNEDIQYPFFYAGQTIYMEGIYTRFKRQFFLYFDSKKIIIFTSKGFYSTYPCCFCLFVVLRADFILTLLKVIQYIQVFVLEMRSIIISNSGISAISVLGKTENKSHKKMITNDGPKTELCGFSKTDLDQEVCVSFTFGVGVLFYKFWSKFYKKPG